MISLQRKKQQLCQNIKKAKKKKKEESKYPKTATTAPQIPIGKALIMRVYLIKLLPLNCIQLFLKKNENENRKKFTAEILFFGGTTRFPANWYENQFTLIAVAVAQE